MVMMVIIIIVVVVVVVVVVVLHIIVLSCPLIMDAYSREGREVEKVVTWQAGDGGSTVE